MVNLKETIQILIDSLELGHKEDYFNNGLCGEIINLYNEKKLTYDQRVSLTLLLYDNEPRISKHPEFYNLYPNWSRDSYWWPFMRHDSSTRQVRVDFLTKLKNEL